MQDSLSWIDKAIHAQGNEPAWIACNRAHRAEGSRHDGRYQGNARVVSSGRKPKGPRLWLRKERVRDNGYVEPAVWIIKDGSISRSTGCGPDASEEAERALADYIAEKYEPPKEQANPDQVLTSDVINTYLADVVPTQSRPKEAASRAARLLSWWGNPNPPVKGMTGTVDDVRTATCKAYVKFVGKDSAARRDLEDLRSAINHAYKERILKFPVPVHLPDKSPPRERWLTRSEVAKLVWIAWKHRRKRNAQTGESDDLAPWKHVARFIIMAHYTGTRQTAILRASFNRITGSGYIDLDAGRWYRKSVGAKETNKRQTIIPINAQLLGHLKRWKANGQSYAIEFNGKPIDRINKAFRALVEETGLGTDIVPHTLRHTAITWAMHRAMDIDDAMGYFGVSREVIDSVYAHHHPDYLSDAANKMGKGAPLPTVSPPKQKNSS